ncbi:hypothetical protein BDV25DRAFT_135771 [Aspergillus avenaceus]|uniref:Uncharacterized protein n=1 Tax=Aspergillus avenaceus TaxID=36643 RepID=A0A5N6U7M6_ASPAV|nr:hypothetical protein BDV25DRAFT_135771 [Aspergillus avenaceus]
MKLLSFASLSLALTFATSVSAGEWTWDWCSKDVTCNNDGDCINKGDCFDLADGLHNNVHCGSGVWPHSCYAEYTI